MNKTSFFTVAALTVVVLVAVFLGVPLAQEMFSGAGPRGPHPTVGIPTQADRDRLAREDDADQATPEPALEVVVFDADGGERIERGVTVRLLANDVVATASGHTDGKPIQFASVPAGAVLQLEAGRTGYETLVHPNTVLPPHGQPLYLKLLRHTRVSVVAEAAPGCVVAPSVLFFRTTMPDPELAENNWIWAERNVVLPTRGLWHVFVPEIPEAEFEQARRKIIPWLVPPGELFRWPGTVHSVEAGGQPLRLTLAPDKQPASSYISGVLRNADGSAEAHRQVLAIRSVGPLRMVAATTSTDNTGRYQLGPVPDGTYLVLVDTYNAPQAEVAVAVVQGADVVLPTQQRPPAYLYAADAPPARVTLKLIARENDSGRAYVLFAGMRWDFSAEAAVRSQVEFPDMPPGWYLVSATLVFRGVGPKQHARRVHLSPGEAVTIEMEAKWEDYPEPARAEPRREPESKGDARDRPHGGVILKLPAPPPTDEPVGPPVIVIRTHALRRDWGRVPRQRLVASVEIVGESVSHEALWASILTVRDPQHVRNLGIAIKHAEPSTAEPVAAYVELRRSGERIYLDCYDLPEGAELERVTVPGYQPAEPANGTVTLKPLK